jgi:hypothetical protein
MLVASIAGNLFAQDGNTQGPLKKTFELPPNSITRRFYIELHQGNEIQLGLMSIRDLHYVGNLDSLIRVCLQDLAPFKDSLSDELTSKKIDYTVSASGRKEIRIRQFAPRGSSYLLQDGTVSALKLEQDTIHILAPVILPPDVSKARPREQGHQFEINIVLNRIFELPSLIGTGIQGKIDTLKKSVDEYFTRADWTWSPGKNGRMHLKKDPDVSEEHDAGALQKNHDRLELYATANFQNYKNYFVPSFSLGVDVLFNSSTDLFRKPSSYKNEINLSWEPQFFFQNTQGKFQTYRNDFLALTFDRSLKNKTGVASGLFESSLTTKFSLAYLIHREGDFYEKNTFRLGTGSVSFLKDKFSLEPIIYFHDLFRGVTPGLRLQVAF